MQTVTVDFARYQRETARIAELEAFVTQVEHIQTEWVTGMTSAQECMTSLSEKWEQVRQK